MIDKRAYFAGERDGEPLLHILRPGEGVKTAGYIQPSVQQFIRTLAPDQKYTYVLVNAMGYSEFYGSNSNRDWYGYNQHLDFNGLLNAPLDFGKDYETDKMQGRSWPYGYPSYYGATVFAHHKNENAQQLGFGDVVFVALNHEMKRVELVMRVFNEEAQRKGHTSILSRISAGERVDVSMGCKVPFDFCSICTDWGLVKKAWGTYDVEQHKHPGIAILYYHKTVQPIRGLAIEPKDYCEHMKKLPGRILPDGRKVYVYNDFCRFFDISFVIVGADRTARVFWFMGGEAPAAPMPVSSGNPGLTRMLDNLFSKTASIRVAMDKEIPDGFAQAVQADGDSGPDYSATFSNILASTPDKIEAAKKLLTAMAVLGVVPSPREFQTLALTAVPGGEIIKQALDQKNVTFDTTVGGIDDTFAVDPKIYDGKVARALTPLLEDRSSYAPFLGHRLVSLETKTASAKPVPIRTALLDKLAAQYNGYRISVLENAGELFPKVAEFLSPEVSLRGSVPGIGMAALLLGLGPMIHLLSSHLRNRREEGQQIGTMASAVANNPDFVTVTTIGAGLRAAMEIDKAGGLAHAARSVVTAARGVL